MLTFALSDPLISMFLPGRLLILVATAVVSVLFSFDVEIDAAERPTWEFCVASVIMITRGQSNLTEGPHCRHTWMVVPFP